jgi:hypothetical protein
MITSLTIMNNGLNMTHSLYKKKNASNQVRLGATTSCNLNNYSDNDIQQVEKIQTIEYQRKTLNEKDIFCF